MACSSPSGPTSTTTRTWPTPLRPAARWSPDGPLWTDLENACSGPVEYDLACLSWRAQPGTEEALAAYGAHDEALRGALEPALALFLAAWTIVVVSRAPTAEGIEEARRRIRRALG